MVTACDLCGWAPCHCPVPARYRDDWPEDEITSTDIDVSEFSDDIHRRPTVPAITTCCYENPRFCRCAGAVPAVEMP